jgi:hypothetical protein
MATLAELHDALVNADKAGDVEAARQLADAIVAASQPQAKSSPVDGMSTTDKVRAGIGRGMSSTGRGLLGAISDTPIGALNRLVTSATGLPGRIPTQDELIQQRDEANRLDAPLLATRAGKVGNVIGTTASAAPAMLIPGANTYAGAGLVGALTGGLTTEGDAKDRLQGAAFGGLGGLAGKGAGDLLGAGVSKLASLGKVDPQRAAAVAAAQDAGYVLPPTEANPNLLNKVLEGLSGKIKTSQAASSRNQDVTNTLAKKAIGANADAPLTADALNSIRAQAGQAYEAVAQTGVIKPTPAYTKALDDITAPFQKAAAGFPNAKPNPIIAEIESLKSPEFDAGAAIGKIRELRSAADAAYAQGNKEAGKAFKSAAGALEDAIDTHLQQVGSPGLLGAFRDARALIAKTYSVQKGLSPTGNVNAASLAKDLAKGRPLSGELRTIAEAGANFPKATQSLQQNYNALSPLDFAVGLQAGTPIGLVARPLTRELILSKPYQSAIGAGDNRLVELLANSLNNDQFRRLLPAAVAANSVPARQ